MSFLYPGFVTKQTKDSSVEGEGRRGSVSAVVGGGGTGGGVKEWVEVKFDDGDNGPIALERIRLLPQDFPLQSKSDDAVWFCLNKYSRQCSCFL